MQTKISHASFLRMRADFGLLAISLIPSSQRIKEIFNYLKLLISPHTGYILVEKISIDSFLVGFTTHILSNLQ